MFSGEQPGDRQRTSPCPNQPDESAAPKVLSSKKLQRISRLRQAGHLSPSDASVAEKLVRSGDKRVGKALRMAEGGEPQALSFMLYNARYSSESSTEHNAVQKGGAEELEGEDCDDDGELTDGTISGDEGDETPVPMRPRDQSVRAPHPAAGGFVGDLPAGLYLTRASADGGVLLCGSVLVRISSKRLFRKWKRRFFTLDESRGLVIYASRLAWENSEPEMEVFSLHGGLRCPNPSLKTTYSLMDDGRRVYTTRLSELRGERRTICKFGANSMQEMRAFACALRALIEERARNSSGCNEWDHSGSSKLR